MINNSDAIRPLSERGLICKDYRTLGAARRVLESLRQRSSKLHICHGSFIFVMENYGPREPHLSRFKELIRQGAGTLDIHDQQDPASSYTRAAIASEPLVQREVDRVSIHLHSICQLLQSQLGPTPQILDLGCGTGATTVALALTRELDAQRIVGADPNEFSLRAAAERWAAHQIAGPEVGFQKIEAGRPLPFADQSFDLCLCVSVIEYLGTSQTRQALASEMIRVTRRGGTLCLVTPSPFRLFDYHTGRFLGDWRRTSGFPWAQSPPEISRMFRGHQVRFLRKEQVSHGLSKRQLPLANLIARVPGLGWALPWQKVLVKRVA